MDRGLRERVRWGNVARAAAVAGVVALVVAWPRLAPDGPRVPGGRAVPVATVPPAVGAPRVPRARERRAARGERRAGEGGRGSRRGRQRPRAVAETGPAGRGGRPRMRRRPPGPAAPHRTPAPPPAR